MQCIYTLKTLKIISSIIVITRFIEELRLQIHLI